MFLEKLKENIASDNITIVAVGKTKPVSEILKLYNQGHRDFGENRVQELVEKYAKLPKDIHWHFIGHLQNNKVRYIAPFVHLIHAVDSEKLIKTMVKEAQKNKRSIDILLQLKIAVEESKYGLDEEGIWNIINTEVMLNSSFVTIRGIMGMASFVNDQEQIRMEFCKAKDLFDDIRGRNMGGLEYFDTLSLGMSGDYETALECGSNMLRIGSLIFGPR